MKAKSADPDQAARAIWSESSLFTKAYLFFQFLVFFFFFLTVYWVYLFMTAGQ